MISKHTNRLIESTSPYLLQHAHNPVDWYEWGEEALLKARQEDKPILVSIGYSSCHWCHVMEREVFEKEEMGQKMNEYLVCIKVDREERPDVDQIYMDAVQAMGQHGGWPLNVFLTPDQKPFYGGTYFPPQQWIQVLEGINRAFKERRGEINESAEQFAQHLAAQDTHRFKRAAESAELKNNLDSAFSKLAPAFDKVWGGLDKAPKFVMPSIWLWLLRYHYLTKSEEALTQTIHTLKKIAMGGIYDQIGGGFARYSVDSYWFAPHFEKMLYDNAQLMSLYAEAYAVTRDEEFLRVLHETFEWLQTEMMHPEGGFYSALDADSEGVEGKFYVWTKNEFDAIVKDDAELLNAYYSIKTEGNWEHGNNIPFRTMTDTKFLEKANLSKEEWRVKLQHAKDRLLAVRDKRIKPGLDDKIILGWNAMMVVGLTDSYKYTGQEKFLKAALRTMEFLERELCEVTTLYRSYKGKRSNTHAFLDDYAYFISACVRLYQVTFNEYWIKRAEVFVTHTIDNFLDSDDGFFHYASKYGEKLIAQKKEIFDNVIPSSNSVMAQNLFHIGVLLDREEWKAMALKMVDSLGYLITNEPNYMSNWGIVFAEMKKGMAEIAFVGEHAQNTSLEFSQHYNPFTLLMGTNASSELPLLQGKIALDGRDTIYVCYDKSCRQPVTLVAEAYKQLQITIE
ncbi:MAG TPA: thioredoxin domain-containing protein [Chryseosolibacter sp.]